ncbi:MAG: hypothetical protein DME04_24520 [Candidatus Rokuibacteriota bacterium]|nr:MAG: hypothetical protein DME04_24520 [Candidatus Rokubacteria bacterium]
MHLFIVSRHHHDLYDYLCGRLSGNACVRVITDRRSGERRHRAAPAAAQRRRTERRTRPEIDEQLRIHSHAIVTFPSETPPAELLAPLRDTLRWVDTVQHHVTAVRSVLYEHERLQRETDAVKQENERLRAEADRARKELEHIDAQLARAITIANDLFARIQHGPAPREAEGSRAAAP